MTVTQTEPSKKRRSSSTAPQTLTLCIPIRWTQIKPFSDDLMHSASGASHELTLTPGLGPNPSSLLYLTDVLAAADGRKFLTSKREPLKITFALASVDNDERTGGEHETATMGDIDVEDSPADGEARALNQPSSRLQVNHSRDPSPSRLSHRGTDIHHQPPPQLGPSSPARQSRAGDFGKMQTRKTVSGIWDSHCCYDMN